MRDAFRKRAKVGKDAPLDDREELTDIPLTPREGWTSVLSLTVMVMTVGVAIDDARWVGQIGTTLASQTGFLPIMGVVAVLVGAVLAKSHYGKYTIHTIGAVIGAIFLLNAVSASVSTAPSIVGRLQDLNLSVSSWFEDVVVGGSRSYETSIFLIVLGALIWGAGQFGAFAVFRRHRPLPAVALTAFMLLINIAITTRDEYVHLIVYVAAALVLLIRLNLLDQTRGWRARGMSDVADISQAFMRNGATFVAVAIVASITLAANASSAPLSRAWNNLDDDLLEVGYAINRWMGGVSGSARGPNILFTPSQTIRGVWESSTSLVFTATTSDGLGHRWRGATYDSFDGNTWQQLDRLPRLVDADAPLLAGTVEDVGASNLRREIAVTISPANYGGDVIVAPESPLSVDQQAEVQVNGPDGPFVAAKLVYGIQPEVPFTVRSLVRNDSGANRLTASDLISASTDYPDWVDRYLAIRPGSTGELVDSTANEIVAGLPPNQRDPYRIALAVQNYLFSSGGFQYNTDVRGLCEDNSRQVDCFLQTRQGYCEHFATAMVMMLREVGVPARYVLGYLEGQEQEDKTWRVEAGAAHAWVEVYFPGYGWVEFDPTPGNFENGQSITNLPAGDPNATPGLGIPGRGELEGEGTFPPEGGGLLPNPEPPTAPPASASDLMPVLAIILLVAAALVFAGIAAMRRLPSTEPEIAYRGIARLASRLGYGPRPAQTAYEFAAGLGELMPVAAGDLNMIATAKVEATYAQRRPSPLKLRSLTTAYRRVRFGLLRLLIRRPKVGLRPRSRR